MRSEPDNRAPETHEHQVGNHAAWAMAVGGMIGGGIFTLPGVILGAAGPLVWISLILAALIALATVSSYARLTIASRSDAVPVTIFTAQGQRPLAGVTSWCLLLVYILALAVYTYTVGHYVGRALGLGETGIAICEAVLVGILILLNLRKLESSTGVQVAAVWIELVIVGVLAIVGFARWNPANLSAGVPGPSLAGVVVATASTFIAFEGFEMLAYDVREVQRPRSVLRTQLPRAIIVVAVVYAVVTIGAASLVGAGTLVKNQENALAVAGRAAAGPPGFIIVTLAALLAGTSAINATLFSVSRLARSTAEQGLLPAFCARCNQHDAPIYATMLIAGAALAIATASDLDTLVSVASLGFLALFCLVNVLAFRRLRQKRFVSFGGSVGAAGGIVVVSWQLANDHPLALVATLGIPLLAAVLYLVTRRYTRRNSEALAAQPPPL